MISFKKAFCALSLGLGLSVSLNAWAIKADCGICMGWADRCDAGDAHACYLWDYNNCGIIITSSCN